MGNHVENGVCPKIKGQDYNPIDPQCHQCILNQEPTVKTSPVFYVSRIAVSENLCSPLKVKLKEEIIRATADP